jgi:hypothetical protein
VIYTDGDILNTATWLYNGSVPAGVRIRFQSMRYGSSDWADDPEVRDDIELPTFVLEYEALGSIGELWNGGGQFPSLKAARDHAEMVLGRSLRWKD